MFKLSMSSPRAILATQLAILTVCTSVITPAVSHGYMSTPRARNVIARDRSEGNPNAPVNYCPHCLNLGGRRTSNLVYPETAESGRSHGLCGDAPSGSPDSCWLGGDCPEQDHMPGGRFYTSDGVGGAIQETYVSGSTIEAEFFITAHHRGFIELRICDEAHVTQECLLKYEPLERVRFEDDYTYSAQPIDPQYPGRFFLNPVCAFDQESDRTYSGYRMTGQFKLPEGVTCDHCVIQMWWITANSCVPPDYEDFQFPSEWAGCSGDGGSGFYNEGGSPCLGSTRAEEFWNCADVRVTSNDGTVPTQSPGAPTESPSPTTPPPSTSPTTQPTTQPPTTCNTQIPLWGKCGGNDGGPWDDKCCAPGSWCRFQNEWYSQCVEGTAPTPSPEESPSPTPSATTQSPSPTPSPSMTQSPDPTPAPTTPTPSPSPTSSPSSTPSPTADPGTTCSKIVPTWSQCAGPDSTDGENVCCASGDVCVYQNSYYSQCRPDMDAVEPPAPGGACDVQIKTWGKCGGRDRDYEGTCCQAGDECVFSDIYYSQCKPKPSPTRKMLGLH